MIFNWTCRMINQSESESVVGKCRFWDSSIFRIRFSFRFWCDDVTSTRCSRDGLWRRRFWDSSIFRIRFSFDEVTSTSVVSAMVGDISDSGSFWCVPGGRVPRCFTVIYWTLLKGWIYISGEYMEPHYYCLTSPHRG